MVIGNPDLERFFGNLTTLVLPAASEVAGTIPTPSPAPCRKVRVCQFRIDRIYCCGCHCSLELGFHRRRAAQLDPGALQEGFQLFLFGVLGCCAHWLGWRRPGRMLFIITHLATQPIWQALPGTWQCTQVDPGS